MGCIYSKKSYLIFLHFVLFLCTELHKTIFYYILRKYMSIGLHVMKFTLKVEKNTSFFHD
ncbi:hypothetical protein BpHYR1_014431 [Brachionus plicatilis]|uniref:Uncharacterized protein n=1 Tax=Brachionus plicatilis TaxID=10195 RepID=A0A3M7PED8_BRAPC|nr:hypothetical protein BpHYR1_014431 [Brachionus plicatilis]